MLAGSLIFYNRSNKVIHEIDLEEIDLSIYQNSCEFFEIIKKYEASKVISYNDPLKPNQ